MDFEEDSFASAPIRYALDDHDSDEEVEASLQVKKVNIQANITLPDSSSTKYTVVFGLEGPGNVYLQSLNNLSATVVGTVTRIVRTSPHFIYIYILYWSNAYSRKKKIKQQQLM